MVLPLPTLFTLFTSIHEDEESCERTTAVKASLLCNNEKQLCKSNAVKLPPDTLECQIEDPRKPVRSAVRPGGTSSSEIVVTLGSAVHDGLPTSWSVELVISRIKSSSAAWARR